MRPVGSGLAPNANLTHKANGMETAAPGAKTGAVSVPSQVSRFHMGAPRRGPLGRGRGLESEASVPPTAPPPRAGTPPRGPLPQPWVSLLATFTPNAPAVPAKHLLSGLWALVHAVPPPKPPSLCSPPGRSESLRPSLRSQLTRPPAREALAEGPESNRKPGRSALLCSGCWGPEFPAGFPGVQASPRLIPMPSPRLPHVTYRRQWSC